MQQKWSDNSVTLTAVTDGQVDNQPWPVVYADRNVFYFIAEDQADSALACSPVNAGGTLCPQDVGLVEFDMISEEDKLVCYSIAILLRSLVARENAEAYGIQVNLTPAVVA
jgi:hypothetical protein